MNTANPRLLLLYAKYCDSLSYYDDWQDAFLEAKSFNVSPVNICQKENISKLKIVVNEYDVIVLLHSTNGDTLNYIKPYQNLINKRKGKLVVFVGNEYNAPPPYLGLKDKIDFLRQVSADFIATQLPIESAFKLYEDLDSKVIALPHALNPKRFYSKIPQNNREIDIGVHSHKYMPYMGDNERNSIIEYFRCYKYNNPLNIQINTDAKKRLSAKDWAVFLSCCKGTISTEAGSYFLEKDDSTVKRIAEYVERSSSHFDRHAVKLHRSMFKNIVPRYLRLKIKNIINEYYNKDISQSYLYDKRFNDIYDDFFKYYRDPLSGKCISSRHFDAIGTKTCQIMFPGKFNDILYADKHYLALKRDFSNMQDVLEKFLDIGHRNKIVEDTYQYIMDCHTYGSRIGELVRILT
jgi:hypothetical protein